MVIHDPCNRLPNLVSHAVEHLSSMKHRLHISVPVTHLNQASSADELWNPWPFFNKGDIFAHDLFLQYQRQATRILRLCLLWRHSKVTPMCSVMCTIICSSVKGMHGILSWDTDFDLLDFCVWQGWYGSLLDKLISIGGTGLASHWLLVTFNLSHLPVRVIASHLLSYLLSSASPILTYLLT